MPLAGCAAAGEGVAFASASRNPDLQRAVVPGRVRCRGLGRGKTGGGEIGTSISGLPL